MFDSMHIRRTRLAALLAGIALGSTVLLGCNLDRPLAPESQAPATSAAVLELTLVGERGEPLSGVSVLGRLSQPAEIAAALRALPEAERDELRAHGTCITSDAEFRAVVRQLVGQGPGVRGVAGHIDNSSWGRIKVHFMPS